MEKYGKMAVFFRAAMAGLGKYCMGAYGWIGVYRVKTRISHSMTDAMCENRMSHLLNLMFDNKSRVGWLKTSNQTTRNSAKIIFESDVVHLSIYNQSPYFVGSRAWNNMPQNLHEIQIKDQFKLKSKEWIRRYVTN